MVSSTSQGALKDGFEDAFVVCDMSKPCTFLSLGHCQKRFPWTHKGIDLAPHPVVGFLLQEGDTEKFPHALGFKSLDLFFSQQAGSMLHSQEEDGGDKRLVKL